MPDIREGKYAYRFSGYAMDPDLTTPFYLVGIGAFTLGPGGKIAGEHRSTLTTLQGGNATPVPGVFSLSGSYEPGDADFASALLVFTSRPPSPPQTLQGGFVFTPAGPDRYWLISTTTHILKPESSPANEVVSGEVVRIGP
jgi:hypothetical protein